VGYAILWVLQNARQTNILPELYGNIAPTLAWMDFILSILLGTAVLLIGQAVVSYGLFTGKPLPRRVFKRQWLYAILIAGIVAIIFAGSIEIKLRMVYSLLLAVILLAVFFAFITWRYISERDLAIQQVRPFLSSPKLVQSIFSQDANIANSLDLQTSLQALARDILEVDRAILVPAGGSSALVQSSLFYPGDLPVPAIPAEIMSAIGADPKGVGYPLQPEENGGFSWIVPLWSERGINGMLYIGRKMDGSFITHEEIELARAASERLLDIALSAELSSRLLKLQQLRFSEQSIMDQRPRRVLHDEVLPALHTAMLQISGNENSKQSTLQLLADTHRMISNLLKELPSVYSPQFDRIGLTHSLQQLATVEFSNAFTGIDWKWTDSDANVVNELPVLKKEVLYYATREAIRNAAMHAVPPSGEAGIRLTVEIQVKNEIEITIQDNGSGVTSDRDSTTGAKQGLAIHSTLMALIGGELTMESAPGVNTRVRLVCPK
jgi:signal transduction histidine kinase